jgi:hypothetical protein
MERQFDLDRQAKQPIPGDEQAQPTFQRTPGANE